LLGKTSLGKEVNELTEKVGTAVKADVLAKQNELALLAKKELEE
jgi:hypothetical protein